MDRNREPKQSTPALSDPASSQEGLTNTSIHELSTSTDLTKPSENSNKTAKMTSPFKGPASSINKPDVPPWIPPQETKMDLDWADLRTIELSLLDSGDPAIVAELVATTKAAIKQDGFLFLTNYGVSLEQVRSYLLPETRRITFLWRDADSFDSFIGNFHLLSTCM